MSKKVVLVSLLCWAGCGARAPIALDGALPASLSHDVAAPQRAVRPPRRFQPRGIGAGGALFGPTISPLDPDEIYVGTDMTDLYHSSDFGISWETIPFTVVQGDSFTSTQFTADPSLLYALTNDAQDDPILVKSVDRGGHWTQLLAGVNVNYVSADPDGVTRLIAVDNNDVHFSGDAGATFTTVYTSTADDGLVMGGAFWHGHDILSAPATGCWCRGTAAAASRWRRSAASPPARGSWPSRARTRGGRRASTRSPPAPPTRG